MSTTSVPAPAINLARRQDLFSSHIVLSALKQSFLMLRPDVQWKNPVMFVVEIGAVLTLLYVIQMALGNASSTASLGYFVALDIWLWLTVLFANFATAVAEERGKAQAETLRKTRVATPAFRLRADQSIEQVSSVALEAGRPGRRRGEPGHPRRWGRDRRRRRRQRGGDHRRVGAGHPRGGRRPVRRDRRHDRAFGPDHRAHLGGAGQILPRQDDRAGRRRAPPAHAQ